MPPKRRGSKIKGWSTRIGDLSATPEPLVVDKRERDAGESDDEDGEEEEPPKKEKGGDEPAKQVYVAEGEKAMKRAGAVEYPTATKTKGVEIEKVSPEAFEALMSLEEWVGRAPVIKTEEELKERVLEIHTMKEGSEMGAPLDPKEEAGEVEKYYGEFERRAEERSGLGTEEALSILGGGTGVTTEPGYEVEEEVEEEFEEEFEEEVEEEFEEEFGEEE